MTADRPEDPDTDVLFGDQVTVQIGGEAVEVRELRWAEGMRVMPVLAPMMAAVRQYVEQAAGDAPRAEAAMVEALLSEHPAAWEALICAATGRPAQWLAGLSDNDGLLLQAAAWRANSGFFTRRPMLAALLETMLTSASLTPSPTSSVADSASTTETSPSA